MKPRKLHLTPSILSENEGTGNAVWPYDKPHYLILNAAIGGSWGGQKGIDDSIFPQKYYIDYVRVYKQQKESDEERIYPKKSTRQQINRWLSLVYLVYSSLLIGGCP